MSETRHTPLAPRKLFLRRLVQNAGIALLTVGGSLVLGMWGYRYFEGMRWIDAFLNAAMLLGGMGPVDPQLRTTGGKLFAGFYALYAGMVVLVAASILVAPLMHRYMHKFHLESRERQN
jgi:hypothetical protein